MNHTPGPWNYVSTISDQNSIVIQTPEKEIVATAWNLRRHDGSAGETPIKANAALISAAPDLLIAAEKGLDIAGLSDCPYGYVYSMGSRCDCSDHQEYRAMYVAVQKAKGIGA